MRRYAIIFNDRIHEIVELDDAVDIKERYAKTLEVIEITDFDESDAQIGMLILRPSSEFRNVITTPEKSQRIKTLAKIEKALEAIAIGMEHLEQNKNAQFPQKTLNFITKAKSIFGF